MDSAKRKHNVGGGGGVVDGGVRPCKRKSLGPVYSNEWEFT